MSKRPMYLQHVNLYVRNAERSKEWYEDLLGLHTYEYRPGWAAFMSADEEQSHEVALMQLGDDAPLQEKGQVGLNHMAWRLESLDDLKEFYRRIKEKGSSRRAHLRSRHIARHLPPRSRRQRRRGVLRAAARRMGSRLPHLLARQIPPWPLPRSVGRRDPRRRSGDPGARAGRGGIADKPRRKPGPTLPSPGTRLGTTVISG